MDLEVLGAYRPFDWGDLGRMEKKHRKIRKKISFLLFLRKDKLVFSYLRGKSERFQWDLSVFSLDSPKMNLPI